MIGRDDQSFALALREPINNMAAPRQERRTAKWHRKEAEYYRILAIQQWEEEIKAKEQILIHSNDWTERLKALIGIKLAQRRLERLKSDREQ